MSVRRTRSTPAAPAKKGTPFTDTPLYQQNVTGGSVAQTPLFRIFLGGVMLLIMTIVACFSVLTTQNLIKGGNGEGVVLHWAVFTQPFDLMQGKYAGIAAVAIIVSWALLVLYLVFGAMEVLTQDGRPVDKLFRTSIFLLLFFDGVATYEYLHILPDWYRWLFTVLVPVSIGFFGKYGLTIVLTAVFDFIEGSKE